MTLTAGYSVGPYELLAAIGADGSLAWRIDRDPRLCRDAETTAPRGATFARFSGRTRCKAAQQAPRGPGPTIGLDSERCQPSLKL